jgi:hypothetical protein
LPGLPAPGLKNAPTYAKYTKEEKNAMIGNGTDFNPGGESENAA